MVTFTNFMKKARKFVVPFLIPFIFHSSSYLPIDSGERKALAIINTHYTDLVSINIGRIFLDNFKEIHSYEFKIEFASNRNELLKSIRKNSPLDALILAFHGTPNYFYINAGDSIDVQGVRETFSGCRTYLSEGSTVILYSCSTGSGNESIAHAFFDVLNKNVVAPKGVIFPEAYLDQSERVSEFSLDTNGRLSFDYKKYTIYDRINFGGDVFHNVIAPRSYTTNPLNVPRQTNPGIDEMFLILEK